MGEDTSPYPPSQLFLDNSNNAVVTWPFSEAHTNTYTSGAGWGTAASLESRAIVSHPVELAGVPASGEAVAVWTVASAAADSGFNTVWFSRFVPGVGWQETTAVDNVADFAEHPKVAMDASGNALVVFTQHSPINADTNIVAYWYDASFGTWSGPQTVDPNVTGSFPQQPAVAMNSAGEAVVAWSQQDTPGREDVWINRYTPTGGWAGSEAIDSSADARSLETDVAIDSVSNLFVVWLKQDVAAGRSGSDLWARRFDATLATPSWESAELIEFDDTVDDSAAIQESQIKADEAGNAIVVWTQDDGTNRNARAARYSITDAAWGAEELLEEIDTGDANGLYLSMERTSGNAAVTWHLTRPDPFWGISDPAIDIWVNRFIAP